MTCQRQVLFIGGFDPKSSPHYHRLYREAASQRPASARGEHVEVSKQRQREGIHAHWDVHWREPGEPGPADHPTEIHTRYTVLGWHDIVHAHWPRTLRRVLRDYLCVYGTAWPDGTFARLWRISRASFWLTQFPLLLGLAVLGLGALLGALIATWVEEPALAGALIALPAAGVLWRELAARLDSEWMLRLFGFTYDQTHGHLPELEARADAFADRIIQAATELEAGGGRELLVVGHSTGTMLAMSALARALAQAPWLGTRGPALSLLTLGHSVPLLALQPSAGRFREEIAQLAACPQLCWIEYAAPTDWAAFHHPPPWLDYPTQGLKLALSPRFHRVLKPVRYHAMLRWHRRHELHLQYLRAPDLPDGYDPVALTAGPLTLAEQHCDPHTPPPPTPTP